LHQPVSAGTWIKIVPKKEGENFQTYMMLLDSKSYIYLPNDTNIRIEELEIVGVHPRAPYATCTVAISGGCLHGNISLDRLGFTDENKMAMKDYFDTVLESQRDETGFVKNAR
jgi:hypothetical protein